MPKSQLEADIEKATSEQLMQEDWALILDIVDRISQTNSEKEALKLIVKRLNARDPHVSMHALTLLNACVNNCTRNFKLEVCSRDFTDEIRQIILKKKSPKLSEKLAFLVFEWSNDKQFKNDPALSLMSSLYADLKKNGIEFKKDEQQPANKANATLPMTTTTTTTKREDDDLAKAIQLSLKEQQAINTNKQQSQSYTQLYSQINQQQQQTAKRRVKALYDFEAVEDNELTFKTGDILYILDDSDANWWKGSNATRQQEGLFPSNFVTSDLNAEYSHDDPSTSARESQKNQEESTKKVSFNEQISVKNLLGPVVRIMIDERRIDECIEQIQDADPTGEIKPDSDEFIQLEDMCYAMGPLIDQELQHIDQKHAMLDDLNVKLIEAFQMYNNLMKESIIKQNTMPSQSAQSTAPSYLYAQQQQQPHQSAHSSSMAYMLQQQQQQQQTQFIPNAYKHTTPNMYAIGGGYQQYGGSNIATTQQQPIVHLIPGHQSIINPADNGQQQQQQQQQL